VIWIWFGVVISLILIEFISKNASAGCFVLSGIISCIMTYFTDIYLLQLAEFLGVGLLLIIFVRPRILKRLEVKKS